MNSYRSIHLCGKDEIIINKSKFIGTAMPVYSESEAIEFVDKIKKEYKDATHNVYAYTIGENANIQRYSDDGEPSGTAGMPVLNVIMQENLRNVAVVVTRYFGGIMLGAGGLVRAYTKAAKIGLESGIIVDKQVFNDVFIKVDYTLLGKVENVLNKNNFIIKDKIFTDNVTMNVLIREDELNNLNSIITEATSAKAEITIGQADYYSIKENKIVT